MVSRGFEICLCSFFSASGTRFRVQDLRSAERSLEDGNVPTDIPRDARVPAVGRGRMRALGSSLPQRDAVSVEDGRAYVGRAVHRREHDEQLQQDVVFGEGH